MKIDKEQVRKALEPTYSDILECLKHYQPSLRFKTISGFNELAPLRIYTDDNTDHSKNNIVDILVPFLEKVNIPKINPVQVATNVLLMSLTMIMFKRDIIDKQKLRLDGEAAAAEGTMLCLDQIHNTISVERELIFNYKNMVIRFRIILDNLNSNTIRVTYNNSSVEEEVLNGDLSDLTLNLLQEHLEKFWKKVNK